MRLTFLTFAQTAGLAVIGVLLGACPATPEVTATDSLDTTDTGCDPGTLDCVCYSDDTCGPGLVCASNRCIGDPSVTTMGPSTSSPPTTGPTTDTETAGTTTMGTDTVGTTEGTECDPQQGLVNDGCGDGTYCTAEGVCLGCSAISCADVSAEVGEAVPVCDLLSEVCVECTTEDASACEGQTPVCAASSNECVPCAEHDECDSGACNLFSGACFPDNALWVDKSAPCNGADGSESKPYCEIQDAVATVGKNDPTVVWVIPSGVYADKVSVESSRIIAIRSSTAADVRLETDGTDALLVNQGSITLLDHVKLGYPSEDRGIVCSGGSLWADDSSVVNRLDLGIDGMSGCDLVLRRSSVINNTGGGIQLSGGSLRLVNSFVVANGGGFSEIGGIGTSQGATLDLLYSSVISNQATDQLKLSMGCSNDTSGVVRNSILLGTTGGGASFECGGLEYEYNALDNGKIGGTNTYIESGLDPAWFVKPQTGDFHLKPGNVQFKDVALWINGDPSGDVDGDARPTVDGTGDYAGADIP